MVSGAINVTAGSMVLTGGEFNWTGGEVNNDLYGRNTRWDVATTVSDTARLIARGSESRLGNNVSRNVTLWVQGGNDIGHATLTADAGLVNHGTIVLESINSNWQSNLTVSGGELQNAFDGVIQVNTGTGGGRTINAELNNQGTIQFATNANLGRTAANHKNAGIIRLFNVNVATTGNSFVQFNLGPSLAAAGRSFSPGSTGPGVRDLSQPSIVDVRFETTSIKVTSIRPSG